MSLSIFLILILSTNEMDLIRKSIFVDISFFSFLSVVSDLALSSAPQESFSLDLVIDRNLLPFPLYYGLEKPLL